MHIVLNATALIPLLYKVPKDMISCGWRGQHLTEDFGTEQEGTGDQQTTNETA